MSAMALLGILLAISVNEILWYSAVGFETVDTVFTTLLKIGVLVTTGAALYFLYKHYTARLNNLRASGLTHEHTLFLSHEHTLFLFLSRTQ
jgi:hypothetical protein